MFFSHRRAFLATSGISVAMLIIGLVIGVMVGSVTQPPAAHAVGIHGGLVISPDGSLSGWTSTIGATAQPAGTCALEGNSGSVDCHFAIAPHAGGAIQQSGADATECFLVQPNGSYFTTRDSQIVYAPSGQVYARCTFPSSVSL